MQSLPTPHTITITTPTTTRIDVYLSQLFPTHSRSQWQRAIKQQTIHCNNQSITPHYQPQPGDVITILSWPQSRTVSLPDIPIPIIAQTDDYLIINKPSGLPVHPDNLHPDNTVIQQLCEQFPDIAELDPASNRPGVVHRLDKDVSGVMVIARTAVMHAALQIQFKQHTIYKEYRALVHNQLSTTKAEIDFVLARDNKSGKMIARPRNQTGKTAHTTITLLQNFDHFALVQVVITTGRTHQIRAHLLAYDHPIVGDTLYAKKKNKATLPIDRIFLHAHTLEFTDLSNTPQRFTVPLPDTLTSILSTLIPTT